MVRDRITGLVVPPKPIAIAEAMDDLFKDKKNAEKMGEEGFDNIYFNEYNMGKRC